MALGACGDLTRIEAPDLVPPSALDDSVGAMARRAGAIARFASAFATQATETGVLTDEFIDANGVFPADRRTVTTANSLYPFMELSRARIDALRAANTLERYARSDSAEIAELYALAGYSELLMAEDLCAPLPLAEMNDGMPTGTLTYTRDGLLTHVITEFDSAAGYVPVNAPVRYLIQLGRARTLMALNDPAAASAAVADIPVTYKYALPFSATITTQANTIYRDIVVRHNLSVADSEGVNGLAFLSDHDPRVVTQSVGASSKGIMVYNFAADSGFGASIILAQGVDALLIRAEAALRSAEVEDWADALNGARQTALAPALPPLPADSTTAASPEERIDVLFRERAFWHFGTGRRLGDMRRLVRQYGRGTESVFPTGAYQNQGISYGPDATFTMRGEEPNASYGGCEDRTP